MRETRSRTSSGPRRFMGGTAISANRIVRIALHDPNLFIDALLMPERSRPRTVQHLSYIVVVVLKRLLPHDDVPATGKGPQHKRLWTRLVQLQLNGMRVAHVDGTDRGEQRGAGA